MASASSVSARSKVRADRMLLTKVVRVQSFFFSRVERSLADSRSQEGR